MQDIFEELKTQVGNIGKELSPEEGDAAITILHDWLEKNSEELVARKNVKEFNGTMMQ